MSDADLIHVLGVACGALVAIVLGLFIVWRQAERDLSAKSAELVRFAQRHVWDVNAKSITAVDEPTEVINKPELVLVRSSVVPIRRTL